jgi:hypothetical protein
MLAAYLPMFIGVIGGVIAYRLFMRQLQLNAMKAKAVPSKAVCETADVILPLSEVVETIPVSARDNYRSLRG